MTIKFQIKTKTGTVVITLVLVKTDHRYVVEVDGKEIGSVWKADGRVKKFRNHRLDGTKTIDRWFAKTVANQELGEKFPYDEGFSSRLEALTDLLEAVLKIKRDWNKEK